MGFVQVIGNGCPIYLRECEARHWISKFNSKLQRQGKAKAVAWWKDLSEDIKKKRGESGLASLIEYIERERGKK